MCSCVSYNQPKSNQTNREIILYNKEMTGRDSVCIDFCIVNDIQKLWNNNIPTLSSCCGHNIKSKSVVVDKFYVNKAEEILPDFDIFYWDLVKNKRNNNV